MKFDMGKIDIAWCPGCGDFMILNILKKALDELEIDPKELVTCSGIGQAAKTPHYLKTHLFNGLHGRAISPAVAIKVTNPKLKVIVTSGDGDVYGEGGNHFIHNMRRNSDITTIVFNNMVYGLTKGQASPSSPKGFVTPLQEHGVSSEPFNPIANAVANGATFVARAFCADQEQTKEIFKKAIQHKGFSTIDVFQPCPTFDKVHTYQWFKENTYYLEDTYEPNDKVKAFERALEEGKFPLGIFYVNPDVPVFEENPAVKNIAKLNVFERRKNRTEKLKELVSSYK